MRWCMSEWTVCDFQRGAGWKGSKSHNGGRTSTARRLERNKVMQVRGLRGCENLVCKREWLVINSFINFEPVQRFKYRWDVTWFGDFNNNTSIRILDELEMVYLRLREIEVEGVTVIKLRVNSGGVEGTSCFKIKIRTNATPSPLLDNIRVMVIVWRLRRNIIRTALCWIVWHNVHSPQHTCVSSSFTSNRLGLLHWDPYVVHRNGCLELYYCNMVEWFWWDSSLIFDDQLVSFSALTLLVWSFGL